MNRYILDTDHVSLILGNHPKVTAIAAQHQVSVTIITVQELFNGWVGKLNDPASIKSLPSFYSKLCATMKYLQTVEILDFTPESDIRLKELLKTNPPLRKNRIQKDMRIAAVALSLNATVVTRNERDFGLVPELSIADWSR
ncbi:type II toxin-antitoxin system VapC family toxin [Leptolyngbya sp. AN03gr2]|uniref:type II toxin-antitoxin system VapC family toxin n=1 Tax=unclassified Leptolyngbya TaxID=2650499 RepID=UPI003D31A6F4